MTDAAESVPEPDSDLVRHPEEQGERRGRSGPDTGDNTAGEGAEFLGDASTAEGQVDSGEADAWFAAHGTDAGQK